MTGDEVVGQASQGQMQRGGPIKRLAGRVPASPAEYFRRRQKTSVGAMAVIDDPVCVSIDSLL